MKLQVKDIIPYLGEYETLKIVSSKTYKTDGDGYKWPFEFIVIETNKKGADLELTWTTGRPKTEEAQKLKYDEFIEYEVKEICTADDCGSICIVIYVDKEGEDEVNEGKGSGG